MKLLCEFVGLDQLEVIREDFQDASGETKKVYKLKGPFLEAEKKNRNGRVYAHDILEREVGDFTETKIKTKRAMGELDHPENPQINLERVSHIIEDLQMRDNIGFGVARILDTPKGRISETLVKEGIVMGMSTRGVGSLDGENVQDDYKLITIDIVADPSAPHAFVEGVLENKEYVMEGDKIVEMAVDALQKKVDKKYDPRDLSGETLSYLKSFLNDIRKVS